MGIVKIRLLVHVLVYLVNTNVNIKDTVKQCATCLDYQQTTPHEKTIPYDLPCKPWQVVGADIFSLNNNTLLCVVDYYSTFPIMRKADRLSADDLIRAVKIVIAEF